MRSILSIGLCLTVLTLTGLAQAQAPAAGAAAPAAQGRGGAAGPAVVSPQVNADRCVTVRLLAPKATEVTVTGEILNGGQPKAMTKGSDGIWAATLGPLPADVYTYIFNVDGVPGPDPRNPWIKPVSNGIKHSFKTTTGRHEWRLWRPHLNEFAQLLFQ